MIKAITHNYARRPMEDPIAQMEKAVRLASQVRAKLESEYGSDVDFEGCQRTDLRFVVKRGERREIALEFNASKAKFALYNPRARTGGKDDIGSFGLTASPDEIVQAVKDYC